MHKPPFFTSPRFVVIAIVIAAGTAIASVVVLRQPDQQTGASSRSANPARQLAPTAPVANISAIEVETLPEATATADKLLPLGKQIGQYLDTNNPDSSVYIEDLNSHIVLHVGETTAYNTKSLMKVPLVMSLYKASELGRLNLDDKVTIMPSQIDREFGDLWQKKAGYKISLREAAAYALQKSDNTAIRLINDNVFPVMQREERAYKQIKIDMRVAENGDSFISTESYSTVFRCLYTACYNSQQNSAELLELMKGSTFVAPKAMLPADTPVAHKIGSVGIDGYNDCGIVYGPKTPFMFCIMLAKGQPQADKDITQIIKLTYDHIEK